MVMAHLIRMGSVYENTGNWKNSFPVDGLRNLFNKAKNGLEHIYDNFINHCRKKLSAKAVEEILDYTKMPDSDNKRADERRAKLYKEGVSKATPEKPFVATVGNVLQPQQCKLVKQRYFKTFDELEKIKNKYKDYS